MQTETDMYLDKLCGQIKWRKARRLVREEIQGHMEQKIMERKQSGMDEHTAERNAAETMGDPVEVGRVMNKLHRPKTDILMIISIAVLFIYGLIILSSSGSASGSISIRKLFSLRPEWLQFRLIGIALFVLCMFVNVRWLIEKTVLIIASGVIALAGLLFLNISSPLHAFWPISNDWLALINCLCICLLAISFGGTLMRLQKKSWIGAIFAVGTVIAVVYLMMFRENAPVVYAILLIISLTVMLWFSNIRTKWKIIATGVIAAAALIYLIRYGYLNTLLSHPQDMSMLDENEIISLKESLGHVQIVGEAPEAAGAWMNDFYLAFENVMVYVLVKFGVLPTAILLAVLGILVWRMIIMCIRIRDRQGRILAGGITAFIASAIAGSFVLNALFIGTSGTYIPFLQGYGTDFILYSVLLGLIAGLYRRKSLYFAHSASDEDSSGIAEAHIA